MRSDRMHAGSEWSNNLDIEKRVQIKMLFVRQTEVGQCFAHHTRIPCCALDNDSRTQDLAASVITASSIIRIDDAAYVCVW